MPAPVNLPTTTTDSAPPRPWAIALPTSPLAAPGATGEAEPVTAEVAQLSMPERPTRSGASNLIQSGVTGSRSSSVSAPAPAGDVAQIQMSGRSLPTDLTPSSSPNPVNVPEPSIAAPAPDAASNLLQPGVARSGSTARNAAAAPRQLPINSQAAASTPSILLGAPAAPATREVSQGAPLSESRSSETQASAQPAIDPALFTKGLAATIAPQSKNLAFSLKMVESNSVARHAQQAQGPEPANRNQATNSQTKSEEHTAEPMPASTGAHATPTAPAASTGGAEATATATAATVNPVWNQAAQTPQFTAHTDSQLSEPHQPANISTVAALHEARPVMPEAPRASAASEILLQLGGKDQAAAIRVSDRAGTVNVAVHATDGDLRSSLRSNLGDLASQLTHQGWKTEVVKTGTSLTRGETSQDPQQDGQRSPGQQQNSSQGERQPQRDRRASGGQWQTEFEEQTGNNAGQAGGKN